MAQLKNIKSFTEKDVERLIKATVTECVEGIILWLEKETDIFDSKTKKKIRNSEIGLKPGKRKKAHEYLYPRLKKPGIIFKTNQ